MGYTTQFEGQFNLDNPLALTQYNELEEFASRDHRNESGVPGYYCQWIPTKDGAAIEWDGNEKFYSYVEWLEYIIEHFLEPWQLTLNGEVVWQGEEIGDIGVIAVKDNMVTAQKRGKGR